MLKLKHDFVCLKTPSEETLDVTKCDPGNDGHSINRNSNNNLNNNKARAKSDKKKPIKIRKSHIY